MLPDRWGGCPEDHHKGGSYMDKKITDFFEILKEGIIDAEENDKPNNLNPGESTPTAVTWTVIFPAAPLTVSV